MDALCPFHMRAQFFTSGPVWGTIKSKESAPRAVVRAQLFARKSAQHKVRLEEAPNGYLVHCSIEEEGAPLFCLTVAMPDKFSAKLARERFIAHGDELYELLIGRLTQEE